MRSWGLEKNSSPFDWVISSWLKNNQYENTDYGVKFFHDFDMYKSLNEQLPVVYKKYSRRIDYFYQEIKRPTLFIRYIQDKEELAYLEANYTSIKKLLKNFNSMNEIIFISDMVLQETELTCFYVEVDENDTVNRNPLFANLELQKFLLESYDAEQRNKNLEFYLVKKKRVTILTKLNKKVRRIIRRLLLKPYIHDKQVPIIKETAK